MPNVLKQGANAVASIFGVRNEEQPSYAVVDKLGDVEIREYGSRLAAETNVVAATQGEARSEAFDRLAKYIFGQNAGSREMAMTAPVATETGRDIAMTAPVQTVPGPENSLTMRFFLPSEITVENAPAPANSLVRIVTIPPEEIAVLQFSGSWSDEALAEHEKKLVDALKGTAWKPVGAPFSQLYDPPWAIPFLRRNEAVVRVERR